MHFLLDILQGAGLATLAGFRPFAATLTAGALASAGLGLSFDGTSYDFLQAPAVLGIAAFLLLLALGREGTGDRTLPPAMAVAGVATGALLFAGSLADRGHASWPGLIAGAACAALAWFATLGLLQRAGRRAGEEPRAIALAGDGVAAAGAGLVVLAPPVALLLLAFLLRLAAGARRRTGERYAGLRVLR